MVISLVSLCVRVGLSVAPPSIVMTDGSLESSGSGGKRPESWRASCRRTDRCGAAVLWPGACPTATRSPPCRLTCLPSQVHAAASVTLGVLRGGGGGAAAGAGRRPAGALAAGTGRHCARTRRSGNRRRAGPAMTEPCCP